MRYLLDTHILLWARPAPDKLSEEIASIHAGVVDVTICLVEVAMCADRNTKDGRSPYPLERKAFLEDWLPTDAWLPVAPRWPFDGISFQNCGNGTRKIGAPPGEAVRSRPLWKQLANQIGNKRLSYAKLVEGNGLFSVVVPA